MDLKKLHETITANRAQATADFVKHTMEKVDRALVEMQAGTEYVDYLDLGEEPDDEGLSILGDLILAKGLKYSLIIEEDEEDKYLLMISIKHLGE